MRITKVSLPVQHVADWTMFFDQIMGTVVVDGAKPAVRLGVSVIEFHEDARRVGDHHLAFSIPEAKFDTAKRWLNERASVLSLEGEDEFECSPSWNAHSIYFDGPGRSVFELIARRDLPHGNPGPFSGEDILCVSEVGVTAPDVPAAARRLARTAGIKPYGAEPGGTFAPVGTTEGLIILVSAGRTWFPTTDRTSAESRIVINAEDGNPGIYDLGTSTLVMYP